MDGLKAFVNQNTLMLAAVMGALTLVAAYLRVGLLAVVLGLLCGGLLMWHARPRHAAVVEDPDDTAA